VSWKVKNYKELSEMAWGIIANAGEGDWDKESKDWKYCAENWREEYHKLLNEDKEKIIKGGSNMECGDRLPTLEEAYEQGKADGQREMHDKFHTSCVCESKGYCLHVDVPSDAYCTYETCPIAKWGK
jgi:hypothetical protein